MGLLFEGFVPGKFMWSTCVTKKWLIMNININFVAARRNLFAVVTPAITACEDVVNVALPNGRRRPATPVPTSRPPLRQTRSIENEVPGVRQQSSATYAPRRLPFSDLLDIAEAGPSHEYDTQASAPSTVGWRNQYSIVWMGTGGGTWDSYVLSNEVSEYTLASDDSTLPPEPNVILQVLRDSGYSTWDSTWDDTYVEVPAVPRSNYNFGFD